MSEGSPEVALLTLLGAAGEALGFDRMLKSNTTTRRTHSLLRQGIMLYQLIPTMPEHRLLPLVHLAGSGDSLPAAGRRGRVWSATVRHQSSAVGANLAVSSESAPGRIWQ